ncbi:MAG TPA: alpha/beta hydrolase [Myxococcota bacterium]|nr:alpha/beta hydrolase [Myxococcota bacterium]
MQPTSRSVPGADGLALNLLEWSAEGVAFLFLHGFSNEAHIWDDLAPVLAPHYRVLALDQRGHGDSDADSEGRYDFESMARDVEAVCEALGIERLVLCGHSMGGRVAMRFAGRNPEKLAGLVIVDVGPELDDRGVSRITAEAARQEPVFDSIDEYAALLSRNYPAARPQAIARMARHETRERADGRFELKLRLDMTKLRESRTAEEAEAYATEETKILWGILEKVACPTLVVRGAASDVFSPEVADRMEEVLPRGELVVIPQAGHSVMTDNPDALRAAIARFALGEG